MESNSVGGFGVSRRNYDAALPLSEEVVATTRRTRGADCEVAAHAIGSLAAVLSQG